MIRLPLNDNMKAFITVKSCQTIDGNKDETELTALGNYEYSDGHCVLEYDEAGETDSESSHTTLEVLGNDKLDMVRTGASATEIIIEPEKTHYSQYSTPYGALNICINSKYVRSSLDEFGGRVRARYSLDFNAISAGTFDLVITVKPATFGE